MASGGEGNPGCLSKFGLPRAKRVVARSMGKSRRMLFLKSGKRLSTDKKGGIAGGVVNRCCCCCRLSCVRRPKTLGSPAELVASDPSHWDFTYEMLRDLLLWNVFFSVEYSTNLDAF